MAYQKVVEKQKPGPKGPRGRELKKAVNIRLYQSDVDAIVMKTGLSIQRWINKRIEEELK